MRNGSKQRSDLTRITRQCCSRCQSYVLLLECLLGAERGCHGGPFIASIDHIVIAPSLQNDTKNQPPTRAPDLVNVP
jgi:hypothetical protein